MQLRRISKAFVLPLICLSIIVPVALWSCKKDSASRNGGTGTSVPLDTTAAVTPVGTPTGTPVSKSIGQAGGTLLSADGKLLLTIPAGALTVATNITIQPVTSTMPGSLGLSYDLKPNGTKFAVPVTLTFHYDSTQAVDKDPNFLFIAYQDSSGAWKGDATNRDVDTVAKTTTLSVSHFTTFDAGEWIFLETSSNLMLQAGQTCDLSLVQTLVTVVPGIAVVTETQHIPDNQIAGWQVDGIPDGDGLHGTITTSPGAHATYTAPGVILAERTCQVEVVTKIHEITYKNGKVWLDINPVKKSVTITLLPYWEYNLRITYAIEDSAFSGENPYKENRMPDYKDYVVFDLNIKTNAFQVIATVSNIKNHEPTCIPSTYNDGENIWKWTPDSYGQIDVDSVFTTQDGLGPDSVIGFNVYHGHATLPGFTLTGILNGDVYTAAPEPFGYPLGLPDYIQIDLTRPRPYIDPQVGFWKYITMYVVPIE
jgi:hypothetical protein